jgi:cytochrome b
MPVRGSVKVWDPLVRIFHWSLAAAFFVAYFSEGEPAWLHTRAGYLAVGLVAVRLVWGFVGPGTARFSSFVTSPLEALRYLLREFTGRAARYLTHNPAGGWMVVALLMAVSGTALSGMGLFAAHDGGGPLAAWLPRSESLAEMLEEVHEAFANGTLILVGLHVAGVVVSSLAHRENLVASMLHGFKRPAGHT